MPPPHSTTSLPLRTRNQQCRVSGTKMASPAASMPSSQLHASSTPSTPHADCYNKPPHNSFTKFFFCFFGTKTPSPSSDTKTMKSSAKPDQRHRFILTSLSFILFLCVLASVNEVRFDGLLRFGRCALLAEDTSSSSSSSQHLRLHSNDDDNEEVRILIGILTLPDQYQRRSFLRLIYGTQKQVPNARVDVKFVFCNLTKEDQKVLVALEIMRYDDIIILDCKENMNKGKTYTYFSSLPKILSPVDEEDEADDDPPRLRRQPPYHYVMKADDDTYFRVENLVNTLRPLPRLDLYYGYVIPCPSMDPFVHYMSGMGYLISWDIVEWLRDSDIPGKHLEGPEDQVFGSWLKEGRRGKNRFNAKWSMYNFPEPKTRCTHELWPDTVAVHLLKNQEKWIRTLKYFNVTKDLKPSKLYHIDN